MSYIYGGIIINWIDEVLVFYVIVSYEKYLEIVCEWDIYSFEVFVKVCMEKECYDVF